MSFNITLRQLYRPIAPIVRLLYKILPKAWGYRLRLLAEQLKYKSVIQVNDTPPIMSYYEKKYLVPSFRTFGFETTQEFLFQRIKRACDGAKARGTQCRVLSVGAGNCDLEASIAHELFRAGAEGYVIECTDINCAMLERGKRTAEDKGIRDHLLFRQADIANWRPDQQYDVIMTTQFLHHVVHLEKLFDNVKSALLPWGHFLVVDMIGRNGHMRWPEALTVVEALWNELPEKYKFHHLHKKTYRSFVNWDCSVATMEGIRAQDILPLLLRRFYFELFIGHSNIIDVFVDRPFGPNFDPNVEWDRNFIDRVQALDSELLGKGVVKPTQMIADMVLTPPDVTHVCGALTPERAVRIP